MQILLWSLIKLIINSITTILAVCLHTTIFTMLSRPLLGTDFDHYFPEVENGYRYPVSRFPFFVEFGINVSLDCLHAMRYDDTTWLDRYLSSDPQFDDTDLMFVACYFAAQSCMSQLLYRSTFTDGVFNLQLCNTYSLRYNPQGEAVSLYDVCRFLNYTNLSQLLTANGVVCQ